MGKPKINLCQQGPAFTAKMEEKAVYCMVDLDIVTDLPVIAWPEKVVQ